MSQIAIAQTSNATVAGSVADQTGGTIPNASVRLTNSVTGTATTVVTKEDGTFQFPNLVPGTYDITATAKTFRYLDEEEVAKQRKAVKDAKEKGKK